MGKKIRVSKKSEEPSLDPSVNLALRELAGWPMQTKRRGAARARHRTLVVYRDALGRVTNSIEQIDEDEYEEYSETLGK